MPPSYHLRVGLIEELDLGFHVNNLSSVGLDSKFNFVRGRVIDLALDPGVQWYRVTVTSDLSGSEETSTIDVFYVHGPLLIDINLSEMVSLVLTPGIAYAVVSDDVSSSDGSDASRSSEGLFARLGLGVNVRVTNGFAVHPEVTAIRGFGDSGDLIYMAGIGFSFGSLPSFADVSEAEPGE